MKFPRSQVPEASVELTPLIDVVFLLLIFFMVSTTFTRETQLTIDLPEAASDTRAAREKEIIEVLVSANGEYAINGRALVNSRPETIRVALEEVSAGDFELPMVISADASAAHQAVVSVMDVAGRMGFTRMRITTVFSPEDR